MAIEFHYKGGTASYEVDTQTDETMYVELEQPVSADGKTYTEGKPEVLFTIINPDCSNEFGEEEVLCTSLNKEGVEDLINLLQYLKTQM